MTTHAFEWTKRRVTEKTKEFLKCLPTRLPFSAQGKELLLFHAAPHKNNLYWYEDRPEKFFTEMTGKTDADILIYGHTHKPYRKDFGNRVFINAGSVGKPKDGDPRACVAFLEVTPEKVKTEFLRVEYDVEGTAAAIVEQGLPPYFAEKLRQGR
jgi:predicted phosphodiesterase